MFQDDLLEQLNLNDPLLLLANKIPWDFLESELTPFYADEGRPAKPIRLMCGLLILKQLENLSDEHLIEQWVRNPCFQAFCGERTFQWRPPCASSDLPHFRKRLKVKNNLEIFSRILKQKKKDKNKVYSPHEPETLCIAKGKSHKKYEFASKVCVVVGKSKGVIPGALNFDKNLYDGS